VADVLYEWLKSKLMGNSLTTPVCVYDTNGGTADIITDVKLRTLSDVKTICIEFTSA